MSNVHIEQISVAPDGTVYFSNVGSSIGRYAPPYTAATFNSKWQTVSEPNAQILGIALDPKRGILYAGSRGSNKIYKIPVNGGPITSIALNTTLFNGATLGPDGAFYFTNEGPGTPGTPIDAATGAAVYRLGPTDTAPTLVSKTPIVHANDLAFGPDGWLYVNQWVKPAQVTRLMLQNNVEAKSEVFVTLPMGSGYGDGIGFDSQGNLYAMAGALYKVSPAPAKTPMQIASPATSGLEFGCGALSCNDLFYATSSGVAKITTPAPGLDVPWHHP